MSIVKTGPYCTFRYPKDLTYLGVRHSLDVKHSDDCSVILRQSLESFVQFFLKFVDVALAPRIRSVPLVNKRGVILNPAISII